MNLKKSNIFLMVLVLGFTFILWANGNVAYAEEKAGLEDAYECYKLILTSDDYGVKAFGLKDFNNDGIPELLIDDASGIITYKNHINETLWYSSERSEMYYSGITSRILEHSTGDDYEDWIIYDFDVDSLRMVDIEVFRYYDKTYYHGKEECSRDEVLTTVDEMVPDRELLTTPYKNTKENQDKYLSVLKLNKDELTLYAGGESFKLTVTGSYDTIKWFSGNNSIAKVSKDGKVTGLKKGSCTIKADVDGKILECTVKVKEISLNKTNLTLKKNETYKLKVNGISKGIKWSSSNKSVVKVSDSGKITAVKKGTATIKATVNNTTYTCKVKVK